MRLDCFNSYKDSIYTRIFVAWDFKLYASNILYPLGIFTYISLPNDRYRYAHIQILCNYQANQRSECNCIHFNSIYFFIINTRFLQETLCHKLHFVPHNFVFCITFLYKYSLVSNRHYTFRCLDYRSNSFIFYS